MDPGLLVFVGIFAFAALGAVWSWRHRRAIDQHLAALGFEPCERDAAAIALAWRALAGLDAGQELAIAGVRRRTAGWGMLYRFTVRERPADCGADDRQNPGAAYPAYLLDVAEPDSLCRGTVSLYVLPPGSKHVRKLIAGVIGLGASRPRLEVGAHPWSAAIVAAHGDAAGKLDACMPAAVQEKLVRAAAHGFFIVHMGGGKAGFAVLSNHRDVDRELAFLAEWV